MEDNRLLAMMFDVETLSELPKLLADADLSRIESLR
jgi:hypothetical protein